MGSAAWAWHAHWPYKTTVLGQYQHQRKTAAIPGGCGLIRSRLLAAATPRSGSRFDVLLVPSLGTRLNDDLFRIAVSLGTGVSICHLHKCRWGSSTYARGLHPLSCKHSVGRFPRNCAINDIVKRALDLAGFSSLLQPFGLDRGEGKRPDDITTFPYKRGKSLVWDDTIVDNFAASHIASSTLEATSTATSADNLKSLKYTLLTEHYIFEGLSFDTNGAYINELEIKY